MTVGAKILGMWSAMLLLAMASSCMDYEDEVRQQARYCEMTEAGNWPDYNESINCK